MDPVDTSALTLGLRRVRTIALARWVGVAFAVLQVLTYQSLPYPPGVREVALVMVAVMAVSNLGLAVARRRVTDVAGLRRLSLVLLVLDVVMLSGLTWVFAFDGVSALFAILFLLPIEGAVLFGFGGAMWTWAAVAVLYVGRELFAIRYDNPFELDSVTFRVGLIGIVAFIVGRLVRDLMHQRARAAAALVDAQAVSESRSRLISMLAHDVRAPISAARMGFDTLLAGGSDIDEATRERVLRGGRRQADRALLLARDLLDLARVESGTLRLEPVLVELADVADAVLEVLPAEVDVRTDLRDLSVMADPVRLEQVLFNLVDNALKHGAQPIELSARARGDIVELTVRDHGPGVPADVELFTPFSAVGEGSVGLGMWIVRQLMEANNGTVEHEDADPGARFVLRLPAPPRVADVDDGPTGLDDVPQPAGTDRDRVSSGP